MARLVATGTFVATRCTFGLQGEACDQKDGRPAHRLYITAAAHTTRLFSSSSSSCLLSLPGPSAQTSLSMLKRE
ncbi:hypothetical protein E2C01_060569 [Portunus trituberculatus]|uniref:Uncharacterized protein n=1 Tax=Portunus trituberculatus TaxID=210409 RepID=A0A5B7H5U8_PORTR|nr:hypothetical protein [Portunus trituberculatus]